MAEQITCNLECEHQITWGEGEWNPQGDYPWVGRVVFCAVCESDQVVTDISQNEIRLYDIQHPCDAGEDHTTILFQAGSAVNAGTYGYYRWGKAGDGLLFESEVSAGYSSAEDAEYADRCRRESELGG